MSVRHAKAKWLGDLKGTGTFSAGPGIEGEYNLASRFENGAGSNPESLLGAAHAACYSMALSVGLAKAGTPVESVETDAAVTLDKLDAGFTVTKVLLTVRGKVPGITQEAFASAAAAAKLGCPISRALNPSVVVELDAQLV